MDVIEKTKHGLLRSLIDTRNDVIDNRARIRPYEMSAENNKTSKIPKGQLVAILGRLMKRHLTEKYIKSEKFYSELMKTKFNSFADRQQAFNCWFGLKADKTIMNALFCHVINDSDGSLNELNLSVANGHAKDFPFNDFVETDNGLTHKMLI